MNLQLLKELKPEKAMSLADIKQNYRKLIKKNHPDLFPMEKRPEQNLIMMEINEIYLFLISRGEDSFNEIGAKATGTFSGTITEIGLVKHADPAYVYYKTAYNFYQRGQYIFNNSRFSLKRNLDKMKSPVFSGSGKILHTAVEALRCYIMAYKYFWKLQLEYKDSAWTPDAREKTAYIEKLNNRYLKIIEFLNNEIRKG